jgi:formamidopyrimidine-DNA glycosylase
MPELPEVGNHPPLLEPAVINRTIAEVTVRYWRMVQSDHASFKTDFDQAHLQKKILRIGNSYFHFRLSDLIHDLPSADGRTVFSFRRTRTKQRLCPGGLSSHRRGANSVYDDSRCFGIMKLTDVSHYLLEEPLTKIGPETFVIERQPVPYGRPSHQSTRPIKEFLLGSNHHGRPR